MTRILHCLLLAFSVTPNEGIHKLQLLDNAGLPLPGVLR